MLYFSMKSILKSVKPLLKKKIENVVIFVIATVYNTNPVLRQYCSKSFLNGNLRGNLHLSAG